MYRPKREARLDQIRHYLTDGRGQATPRAHLR